MIGEAADRAQLTVHSSPWGVAVDLEALTSSGGGWVVTTGLRAEQVVRGIILIPQRMAFAPGSRNWGRPQPIRFRIE